jgi:hypothetical protein
MNYQEERYVKSLTTCHEKALPQHILDLTKYYTNQFTELREYEKKVKEEQYEMEKLVKYAYTRQYEKLEEMLNRSDPNQGKPEAKWTCNFEIHNTVARIAILCEDRKMFAMTHHHPRKLLEETSSNPKMFQWLWTVYEDGKDDIDPRVLGGNGIPSYVWYAMCLDNIIFLIERGFTPSKGEVRDDPDIQDYCEYLWSSSEEVSSEEENNDDAC